MATLVRRETFSQPTVNPSLGTMAFGGTGGSSPVYRGANPIYTAEAGINYLVPNPITDYQASDTQYNQDTSLFGLFASFYGPNMRKAQDVGFSDMYGDQSFANFGFGGGNAGVRTIVDPDLANKQAEFGSTAWYRKTARDLQPADPAVDRYTQDVLASRNPQYFKQIQNERQNDRIMQAAAASDWNYYYGGTSPTLRSNELRTSNGTIVSSSKFSGSSQLMNQQAKSEYLASSARNPITVTQSINYDWNRPNVNYFGIGSGVNTFRSTERLAPTSISQGRGVFTGPTYSLRTTRGY